MTSFSPYASPSSTRAVLDQYGLDTKKALGQHFLINDGIIGKICALSEVNSEDVVLELGPGIGTLSYALLDHAHALVSVERDADMIPILAQTCAPFADSFAVIHKDALDLTLNDIERALTNLHVKAAMPNKFIANLPYSVAATLVLDMFQKFDSLQQATIMVQTEVAERMCAQPGTKEYGAYTIKLSLYVQPAQHFLVNAQNFFPPPRVSSTVLRLNRHEQKDVEGNAYSSEVLQAAAIMADAGFANRRKTIANSFKSYFKAQGEKGISALESLDSIFQTASVNPSIRGEALSTEQYLSLGQAYIEQLAPKL